MDLTLQRLPPRRPFAWACLVAGVICAPVPVRTLAMLGEEHVAVVLAMAATVALVLVGLPLAGAWLLFQQQYLVGTDEVVYRLGSRTRRLRYADLSEVRAVIDHAASRIFPVTWRKAVVLVGRTPQGRRVAVTFTCQYVETVDPLLIALQPVVRARPDLLRTDTDRRLFEEYVAQIGRPADR